ncbi:MAG: hypothetical protein LBQ90_11280, partial [Synergistaceae bacterium]|nr:hypothetical protein [Synergistaceae bacterium]
YPKDSAFVGYNFLTSNPHYVKKGDRLEVTVDIPGATIVGWEKDGAPLKETGSTCIRAKAEESDAGIWTAKFTLNDHEYFFPIEVLVSP